MVNQAKKHFRVAIALLVSLIMMSSFFAPVFAWYINSLSTAVKVESGIVGSYFEQGDGTADTPYVIARPIQLYYFAWLQDLGYFDGENPASKTSDKKFYFTLGADIDMSENSAYSILPPIGTIDHPFVGVFDGKYHYAPTDEQGNAIADEFDPNNTKEGTYHVITNVTISNDGLSNIPTSGEEGQQYIGLFGVIGSMSDRSVTGTVKNFGLYDVVIETEDPQDNQTIIGIVAGYCNGVFEGIGVSDCTVKVKNGVNPAPVTTYQIDPDTGDSMSSNVTPSTLSFSLIGFSDMTYQAYNISPVAGGNEFGGSIAMQTIYDKIISAKDNANAEDWSYYRTKTVNIDENGVITESYNNEARVDLNGDAISKYYYLRQYQPVDESDNVYESYSVVARYSDSQALLIADGNGHFLAVDSSGNIYDTDDESQATVWSMGTQIGSTSGTSTLYTTIGGRTRYLRQSNGTLSTNTSSQSWNIAVSGSDYTNFKIYNNNYYITYNNGWKTVNNSSTTIKAIRKKSGDEVTQFTYLNGGRVVERYQKVTTITHTKYDAYLIQDGNGNYLVGTPAGNISNTSNSENATAWRFSNGASGGTFSIQSDDEITYYLRNNNGTLEISTTSTNWTVSNGQISNNGYYLTYLDGTWKLWQETTYYVIDDGDGHYLNYSGGITSGASSTTRWHIDASNKIYCYNGTTKTYLYNNSGTLTTTTTVGTASAWTVNNSNHTIKTGNYYLMYFDGAWRLLEDTEYFSISNGSVYLNFANNNLTSGASFTTRWHIDANNRIYTYNGTTKTYLYNNNGTLATTTTVGTASAWTISDSNHTIKTGNYYLMYLDGAWRLLEDTEYYSISDGNGHYLNLTNGNLVGGASSTTRWHFSNGDNGGLLYTYVNGTKTYLYRDGRTLATTTTAGSAASWAIDDANHNITTDGYYLCYNDSAWGLTEETVYYVINNGSGTYLNLSNGNLVSGASSTTRWYVASNKIYAYNGDTKTYLYNNGGMLSTTTAAGSAAVWTIDSANHTIKTGDYYLCYNDSAWGLKEEAGYYLINDGSSHYLNLSSGSIAAGINTNATRWYTVDNKLYTYDGNTKTYLYNNGGVLSTTTNSNSATTWTIANNNIKNGDYYLVYENDWMLTKEVEYTLISDGGSNYFNLTSNGFEIGTSSDATKWHNASGKLYAYVNGTATYLVNNGGILSTTTSSNSATTWAIGADSITNGGYYLVYQNGWLLTNESGYYLISDGSGHYFNLTSNGFEVGTSSTAVGWHFSNGASGGNIYTYVNGVKTYLVNNNGALSTTTTVGSASSWTVSNGQISNNGYYIIYSNGWLLSNVTSYYTISDGSGHYFNLTSSGFEVGTSSNATAWQMTDTSSGKIYTYINGTATYLLNNNGTLSTTTNSNNATTWTIDGANDSIKNNGYYLTYNSTNWVLTNNVSYYLIHDNNNHYLNLNSSTHLTEVGNSNNATVWKLSNKSNGGYISANVNGTDYYLNYVDGNMVPETTASTSWTVDGNTIYFNRSNDAKYYFFCDGSCWTLIRDGLSSYYLIQDTNGNDNYLSCTTSEIQNETIRSYAKKWAFSSGNSGGTISTNINGTVYYLYAQSTSSGWFNTTNTLVISSSNSTSWTYNSSNRRIYVSLSSGWFGSSTYYVQYNNTWSISTNTYNLTVTNKSSSTRTAVKVANSIQPDLVGQYASGTYDRTNTIAANNYDLSIDVENDNFNLTANTSYTAFSLTANAPSANYSITANTSSSNYDTTANTAISAYNTTANASVSSYDLINETEATTVVWKNTVVTREPTDVTSAETYIALASDANGVSLKNTGYIVGGSNYVDHSTYSGDIRVSRYGMNNLSASTNNSNSGATFNDSRLEVLTQTYLSNGLKRIYDTHNASNSSISSAISGYTKNANTTSVSALGLEKYDEARDQLGETLNGQSNVYGLHFMDAQISTNNIATIEKAVINGSTYTNYTVPRDCIDFNLSTKGSINFFAGSYFTDNDSFFSLHRIFRTDGEIVSIKEISKIYGVPNDTSKNYIYWYVGESQPTLPSGYVEMFDTDWIKNPTMVNNAMYYYEIPVNAGEYALGSVTGKLGAYLIYLDIGASAQSLSDGTTLETAIKGIDFVTIDNLSANSIATTLGAIDSSTPSSAVIILKSRFQGEIEFTIQEVTVDNAQVLRISYTLSDGSAKDYVLWTKADSSVEVVDGTAYT